MYGGGRLKRFSATGDISTGGKTIEVKGFTLSPGTAISTFTLREGGGSGTIVGQWVFAANANAQPFPFCFPITDPHLTIAGAAAEASFLL